MAGELIHGDVGQVLTEAEYDSLTAHVLNNQARGDLVISNTAATGLIRLAMGAQNSLLAAGANDPEWVTAITLAGNLSVGGDSFFVGVGSGLPYGEISVNGNAAALAMASQDTYYQFVAFDTNGPSNLMTPDHTNDHITITKTGVYRVMFSCSFSGSASTKFEIELKKDNGTGDFTNVHIERALGAGGDVGSTTGTGIVSLTAGETIEMWAQRLTGGGVSKDFVGRDVTMSTVMIGG